MAQQSPLGQGLLIIEASPSHSDTPHSVGLLRMSDQPDSANVTRQHATKETDIHSGIWTRIPSKRVAADSRLRPRGRWNRHKSNT